LQTTTHVEQVMKRRFYTLYLASSDAQVVHRLRVPAYLVQMVCALAIMGAVMVVAAVGSYTRMLLKVASYNALRREETHLKQQYVQLQAQATDATQQLSSLQSLATEVAMTYGIVRWPNSPFTAAGSAPAASKFESSLEQFQFLVANARRVPVDRAALELMPAVGMGLPYLPSLWPLLGRITGGFGQRLDPFSGEGAFHTGVDIAARLGTAVRAAANGVVVFAGWREGYGRLVIIDHGGGLSTWYAHLSAFSTREGAPVTAGDVIGYVGVSGRATAPHVHYEVRINNTPVNPWRYLRRSPTGG
jgi:murein DD-endopeptidase MepM/ murein hydrolase activator NlpD